MIFLLYMICATDSDPKTEVHANPFNLSEYQSYWYNQDVNKFNEKFENVAKEITNMYIQNTSFVIEANSKVKSTEEAYKKGIQEEKPLEYKGYDSKLYIDAIIECEKAKINLLNLLNSSLSAIKNIDLPDLDLPMITKHKDYEKLLASNAKLQSKKEEYINILNNRYEEIKIEHEKQRNELHSDVTRSFVIWLILKGEEQNFSELSESMSLIEYLEELKGENLLCF